MKTAPEYSTLRLIHTLALCLMAAMPAHTRAVAAHGQTVVLQNASVKAAFRSGVLCELTNLRTGISLANSTPQGMKLVVRQ